MSVKPGTPACPQCGKPTTEAYRPFCSKRCSDIDLARWLRGDYVIPGPSAEVDDEAPPRGDD
ncbi:MAG: DNA gyrase inhibitor YacG [Rhodobacteraceae bacterium]|jgi:hypothetical protein|nr:DNA gyrase inhibitor YacG [Paracoccaceae bacterium]